MHYNNLDTNAYIIILTCFFFQTVFKKNVFVVVGVSLYSSSDNKELVINLSVSSAVCHTVCSPSLSACQLVSQKVGSRMGKDEGFFRFSNLLFGCKRSWFYWVTISERVGSPVVLVSQWNTLPSWVHTNVIKESLSAMRGVISLFHRPINVCILHLSYDFV